MQNENVGRIKQRTEKKMKKKKTLKKLAKTYYQNRTKTKHEKSCTGKGVRDRRVYGLNIFIKNRK